MEDPKPGQPDVVVVGSLNVDATVAVESIPAPGETVLGGRLQTFAGGKGLNQAVAAARAGARAAMVGRVGDDDGGRMLRQTLEDHGVDHRRVIIDEHEATGTAFIAVDGRGENAIVVSPGANGVLDSADVNAAAAVIAHAPVVLIQLEVPLAVVEATVTAATGTVIVNPAPAQRLPDRILARTNILVPNRSELATLVAGDEPATIDEVTAMVAKLGRSTPSLAKVIVTLGADGVVMVGVSDGDDSSAAQHVAAPRVEAVDTTGAGDCFCGSLAARLATGASMSEAVDYAVRAAALSVTRPGASQSMPTADEVLMSMSDRDW